MPENQLIETLEPMNNNPSGKSRLKARRGLIENRSALYRISLIAGKRCAEGSDGDELESELRVSEQCKNYGCQ